MKILVTGASGFLGKSLCQALSARGHEVQPLSSKTADLRIATSLDPFRDTAYDVVYHLAAWTQAGDFCLYHPGEQWLINQQINTNVLAWWQQCQSQAKLVAIGTSCAYAPDIPAREENYLAGLPIESLFTYGMTKRMLYVGLRALHKQFGLRYLCVVPSTLYGPGYHTDGRQMHFIFDLIRKILAAKLHGTPAVLWGDGHQKREVVFVDDFIEAMLQLVATCDNELVNIGAGEEYSIRQFAERICALVDYDPNLIQYDTSRYVGARSKFLILDKLQTLMPTFRATDLEVGLKRTIDWFLANQDRLLHG
jgi:GDP-L-fucose synthase